MSTYSQNWDGVTAPAVPGDWAVDPAIATTTTPYGMSPFSSPNCLVCSTTGAYKYATYNTPDANSGNVTITGTFAWNEATFPSSPDINDWGWSVFGRGSSSTLSGSTTQYEGRLTATPGVAAIYADMAGSETELGYADVTLAAGEWYQLSLQLNGNSLMLSVERLSDDYWLTPSGTFSSSPAAAVSITDSSISGAGYAGLALYTTSGGIYADDFTLANYPPAAFLVAPATLKPRSRPLAGPVTTRLFG